jgi:hypothetical protein
MEYSTLKMLKSRRLRWAEQVAKMEVRRNAHSELVKNNLEDRGHGRITLRMILRRQVVKLAGGWHYLMIV